MEEVALAQELYKLHALQESQRRSLSFPTLQPLEIAPSLTRSV